jgi:thioredoxin 1
MKRYSVLTVICFSLFLSVEWAKGAESDSVANAASVSQSKTVKELYPNMEAGFLQDAVASDLPDGVLLKSDNVMITEKELNQIIADANDKLESQLKKYASFVLEQIALPKLLVKEIKSQAQKDGSKITETDENKIIQNYLLALSKTIKVSEAQILEFYNSNKESLSGATLEQVKTQITQLLSQQELQKLLNERIDTLGSRMKIEVSASWLKTQAALETENPVSKARASGIISLVDFGSTGCVPCEMLAPILKTLKEKYKGRANVVLVQVTEEPVLASVYGVEVIPVQIFYDKAGKEVYRHAGFFPQEEIEKQLSQMGVK